MGDTKDLNLTLEFCYPRIFLRELVRKLLAGSLRYPLLPRSILILLHLKAT